MSENNYDIGIVGGGPAGYTLALHASAQSKKVVLFEKDEIGGVCLNKGCIPTKSILHSSEVYKQIIDSSKCGIYAENIKLDYAKVIENKNKTVATLKRNLELSLKNSKVEIVKQEAEILNSKQLQSQGQIYNCDKIVCAAGSRVKEIKGLEFDHEFILSSDDILGMTSLPKSILIIGSGAIGIEWTRIFSNFGVEITVVELASHLLPIADVEVSKRIERIFKSSGIKYYTNTTVKDITEKRVTLSNDIVLEPEIILVGAGRIPNVEKRIEGICYIGDASGEIQLAHYAIKQAIECLDNIPMRKDLIPSVVYGTPEIAWVGKREQDLEPNQYKKSMILISALGKSHCDMQTEGFIKILTKDDKILGAHIVSKEASSLLQQIIIAMHNDISSEKLKEVCFAHPTYSEGIFDVLFKK